MLIPKYLYDRGNRGGNTISLSQSIKYYFELLLSRRKWLANPVEYRLSGNQDWYRNEYLQSAHWHDVRANKLAEVGYYCEQCGQRDSILDVHHLDYERLGFELSSDLEVLCRECHQLQHLEA